jgi:fatty acid desaturase
MDGFVARKGLLAPGTLKRLSERSDARGWLQLGGHLGALAATTAGLAAAWGTWWAVPLFAAQGVLLNFLYAGQHELSHYTVFRTRRLNELWGRVFGLVVLYPRDYDRIMHFAHHRHTQDLDLDAELVLRPPYTLRTYLLYLAGPSYWYFRVRRLLRHAAGKAPEPFLTDRDRPLVVREARAHLAAYAGIAALSVAAGSWAALQLWLLPMLAMKWVHQLQNTIEHTGLTHDPDILANTRTVRTNALMRRLAWNMPYHTAHHAFPGVPFHRLPELHRAIVDRTGAEPPTMGYLAFQREIVRKLARVDDEWAYPKAETWVGGEPAARPSDPTPARA